ncbi:Putative phospholipid/glycerol acyltransferase [Colletotrichum destructivum]|uniref:Phospholipid/glycerol acyltransferase n=1 Tax=Colletotrichum destructivum TaxID=34406 RepID=A0AAX4J319_9PEZI|nr:Putative phospholipid/glycerol acyltransferase [Colletotrichum destructivum]
MEKFSQFRDKGSGISPFIPVKTGLSPVSSVFHTFLFCVRLPIFLTYATAYFLLLQHLPFLPVAVRKVLLWGMMGIPGIWWVDLQLDGVRRGTLAEQPPQRFPHPGSVIAANFTSPIDALYLAAIFDPIFTISYPNTRAVERVSLLRAVLYALSPVRFAPPPGGSARLTDLAALLRKYPDRVVAVFPEGGTTNGKGVLPFTPSLLALGPDVHIFPVSIRYTPADITTPVPGRWFKFLWDLLSRPTTCIRVRVAESILNSAAAQTNGVSSSVVADTAATQRRIGGADPSLSIEEQRVLDKVGEALARLCRNKRVGLTLRDKEAFIEAWNGRK